VTVWRKGVLICAAPDILYAEDTDGDGKADVVKKLFSGFGTHNYQARVNSLTYGLDGWVYGSCGLFGGEIKSFNGKTYHLGNRDFRIKPDTGELEPVTGTTQQGRVRDDWGNWFGCDNSTLIRHYVLDDHYLKRNPHVVYPNAAINIAADPIPNRLYPLKSDAQRFALSGPPNAVTAACGLGIYRDNLLGEQYRGDAFTCEPVNLCVHRLKLTPKGSTFEAKRPADEQTSEFLASTDKWFRPVQAVTGPDGCLWIVDMYRFVIEHPRWIPHEDAAKLDLRAGQGMGRIYRVRPKDSPAHVPERLDKLNRRELFEFLNNPNGWQRDTAMQMLEWTPEPTPAATLEWLAKNRQMPETRLGALACLTAIDQLPPAVIEQSTSNPSPGVRRWAIRFAERLLQSDAKIGPAIAAHADDEDAQVRLQVAYSLGEWDDPKAAEALGHMAVKYADDPYLTAAVLSSLTEKNLPGVLATVLKEAGEAGPPPAFIAQLMRMAAATKNDKAEAELLAAATTPKSGKFVRWQFEAVAAAKFDRRATLPEGLRDRLAEIGKAALRVVADTGAQEADRIAAVALISRDGLIKDEQWEVFKELLSPASSPALRAAAVEHLGQLGAGPAHLLLEGWKTYPPAMRNQVLDILMSRDRGPEKLLDGIAEKKLAAAEIDAARRQRLLNHPDKAVRERAAKVFDGAVNPDRAKVLKEYADVTANGDADRGKAVFTRVCAGCHKLAGVGVQVGPDLAALANRTPAYLLQEILDPNRNLDSRYVQYQAVTKAGRTVTGILAGETATTIILRGQERKEENLLRSDIEELRGSGKSLMPEGIEKDISKKDMADLLTFLTAVRTPPKAFPGNAPRLVKAVDGRLILRATEAEIYGGEIAFEEHFKNIGMWHGPYDRVEWRVSLPKEGTFDVYLDFACDAGAAGNELTIDGADPALNWKVASTGAWSKYETKTVGTVKLPAGEARLVIRPTAAPRSALIDLRTVYLVPPGRTPKAEPKSKN
jgi:putative membrane-bound dehydrogenase-like protein